MTSAQPQTSAASETQLLYSEFVAAYDRADALCKRVQLFREEAGIPAINEIRYAGYHLRQSINKDGFVADQDQLRRAKSHAQRACYEAAEAGLVLALKEINLFRQNYKDVIVTGDVKDYIQIITIAEEAKKRLGAKRQLGDGQQLDHTRHEELFEYLSSAAEMLHAARPEINKRMHETRTVAKRWKITTAIAICAALAAFFKEKILAFFI